MRSTWYRTSTAIWVVLAIPAAVLAHPGHPGHDLSAPAPAVPLTGEDCLTAAILVAGLLGVRTIWRRLRRQAR